MPWLLCAILTFKSQTMSATKLQGGVVVCCKIYNIRHFRKQNMPDSIDGAETHSVYFISSRTNLIIPA